MHSKAKTAEPETLRVHREMYERRLRELQSLKDADNELVDAANSPAILEQKDSGSERGNEIAKKAAYLDD